MLRVLLAFADVGLGVQLQEALEAVGLSVGWDAASALGPLATSPGPQALLPPRAPL